MSFLFGSGKGRSDRDREAGRKRSEAHLARDIGNESYFDDIRRPRRKRWTFLWPVVIVIVVMVLGGLGLLPTPGGGGPSLETSCTEPAMALSSYDAAPGDALEVKTTGPDSGDYILVLDGDAVTANGDDVSVRDGTVLSTPFNMEACAADGAFTAPTESGTHKLRLMHRTDGGFAEAATVALTIS